MDIRENHPNHTCTRFKLYRENVGFTFYVDQDLHSFIRKPCVYDTQTVFKITSNLTII